MKLDPSVNLGRLENQTRRNFLLNTSQFSLGAIALESLLHRDAAAAAVVDNPLAPRAGHFKSKAKRVIYLHMSGGPPHLDIFDYKPELNKINGQPFPESFTKGQQLAQLQGAKLVALARGHFRESDLIQVQDSEDTAQPHIKGTPP